MSPGLWAEWVVLKLILMRFGEIGVSSGMYGQKDQNIKAYLSDDIFIFHEINIDEVKNINSICMSVWYYGWKTIDRIKRYRLLTLGIL